MLAAMFGVGAGFTLDEFALWVYLEDVYWAEEGRSSFDAVVVAALLGGLVVLGLSPFDLPDDGVLDRARRVGGRDRGAVRALAILKGKPMLGLIGCSCRRSRSSARCAWPRPTRRGLAGAITNRAQNGPRAGSLAADRWPAAADRGHDRRCSRGSRRARAAAEDRRVRLTRSSRRPRRARRTALSLRR